MSTPPRCFTEDTRLGYVSRQALLWRAGRGEPRQDCRRLHNEILARFIESRPEIRRDKKAIVLAGPPGAGKSTAQAALIQATRTQPEHWLPINADDFKDELLQQARQDGSYDSYLVPDGVRPLEAAGEKFYPRELAALVHTESSILAKKARNEVLESGMNVIIDGTLVTRSGPGFCRLDNTNCMPQQPVSGR